MNPRTNDILGTLPENELAYLEQHLKLVSLTRDQVLFVTGQSPDHAYFPVSAIISMMRDMPDGSSVETRMLGRSGMARRTFQRSVLKSLVIRLMASMILCRDKGLCRIVRWV